MSGSKYIKSISEVVQIYDSFENLEEAKKLAIINAGFKVFGENGYRKASVEEITKEAGISKGSIFYYFESKKNFYLYLYEYSAESMKKLIDDPDNSGRPTYMQKTDFFERLYEVQTLKMKHAKAYPHIYTFMKSAVFETAPAVRNEIQKFNETIINERATDFYYKLDTYKFKEGVDPRMVLQLVTWCAEGCANQFLVSKRLSLTTDKAEEDFKDIVALYNTYIELLRNNFYKEEYLKP